MFSLCFVMSCEQSFDYIETENEEFLRLQALANPRVSVPP